LPNIIEEQIIVVYVALPFQGISWKVHSKFVYGHIKTHPYSPCKNKDGFFLVNFFCSDIWTFLIKCFSHNKILPWFLVQNTFILFYLGLWFNAIRHIVDIMVASPNAIPSLVVLDFAPQSSSSNSRWKWRCEWMGSQKLKMVL